MAKRMLAGRKLNVRPDTLDFRDRMFEPTLVEVPPTRPLEQYLARKVPILDQGTEGACTGFALATVANYLLRSRRVRPDRTCVSPRMFYEMARRYDEWPGEDYDGSSARGAMKGWHKHGVCSRAHWPDAPKQQKPKLWAVRWADGQHRPLGSYYRVNHRDLVAMHSAIAEVGVLYATLSVHTGWDDVDATGVIPQQAEFRGGHAVALVGYDALRVDLEDFGVGRLGGIQRPAVVGIHELLALGTRDLAVLLADLLLQPPQVLDKRVRVA